MKKLMIAAALAASAIASPAMAQEREDYRIAQDDGLERTRKAAHHWELAYLGMSAVDLIQTMNFDDGEIETNPFFRKHPRKGRIIAAKVAAGAIHYTAFRFALKENPRFALRMAQVSFGIQGGIVAMNAKLAF